MKITIKTGWNTTILPVIEAIVGAVVANDHQEMVMLAEFAMRLKSIKNELAEQIELSEAEAEILKRALGDGEGRVVVSRVSAELGWLMKEMGMLHGS